MSTSTRGWLNPKNCKLSDLEQVIAEEVTLAQYPWASDLKQQVPIYDAASIRQHLAHDDSHHIDDLMAEWNAVWEYGPGILIIQSAFNDHALIDQVTAAFQDIIESERGYGLGDHFAKPGANDRIWNALEKLCSAQPQLFLRYYANDLLAAACTAWLGPGYQTTSQVNVVKPGGDAQTPHRDFHLGFMSAEQASRYPEHVHRLSPLLTLQGGVAHVDMPLESGPTLYLPHSQKYRGGYLIAENPEFQAFFEAHQVQLPLNKGDAVFFNPALLHAAGHNHSQSIYRMANLLQISSPFGRSMESVDRVKMSRQLYPLLKSAQLQHALTPQEVDNSIASFAEGYSFPTNLDSSPPVNGLAPLSQADLTRQALEENWSVERLQDILESRVSW